MSNPLLEDWPTSDAGEYNDEHCYNDNTDTYVKSRLKVKCPKCGRTCTPLLSSKTVTLDSGLRWVGMDYQEPYVTSAATCPGCKARYRFTTFTPQ